MKGFEDLARLPNVTAGPTVADGFAKMHAAFTTPEGTAPVSVFLPGLKIKSLSNLREHWAKRARRSSEEKFLTQCALIGQSIPQAERLAISLVRQYGGRQKKMDDDNLRGAFKATRDAVASWLMRDDGEDALTWEYHQERTNDIGIRITITETLK